jgi:hypothetical protein
VILVAILNFTTLSGSDKTQLIPGEKDLKVIWRGWVRWKLIRPAEVGKIVLGRLAVLIYSKDTKPVRLDVSSLEKEQRTKVYSFLIEYARLNNIVTERHGQET